MKKHEKNVKNCKKRKILIITINSLLSTNNYY